MTTPELSTRAANTLQHTLGRIEEKLDGIANRMEKNETSSLATASQVAMLNARVMILEVAPNLSAKVDWLNTKVTYGLGVLGAILFLMTFFGNAIRTALSIG